jgi:hypothetical protein
VTGRVRRRKGKLGREGDLHLRGREGIPGRAMEGGAGEEGEG